MYVRLCVCIMYMYVCRCICTLAGNLYQTLPNQNTESGDKCHLLFHGICLWLTSSDPSFTLILNSYTSSHHHFFHQVPYPRPSTPLSHLITPTVFSSTSIELITVILILMQQQLRRTEEGNVRHRSIQIDCATCSPSVVI